MNFWTHDAASNESLNSIVIQIVSSDSNVVLDTASWLLRERLDVSELITSCCLSVIDAAATVVPSRLP